MSKTNRNYNRGALAEAFGEHRSELLGYIVRRTGSVADAEDIVQDTFLRLLEADSLLLPSTLKALVFRTANNILIDQMRRRQKRDEIYSYIYDMSPAGSELTTEHSVLAHEIEAVELAVVSRMPAARKRVYMLVQHEDKPVKDVARTMGIDCRTVSSHLFFGRRDVRHALKVAGF